MLINFIEFWHAKTTCHLLSELPSVLLASTEYYMMLSSHIYSGLNKGGM